MLSKNEIKRLRSLHTAKGRREEGCFVAEGPKLVGELLPALRCQMLVVQEGMEVPSVSPSVRVVVAKADELERASSLQAPQGMIGVFHIPEYALPAMDHNLVLALDGVQDPGNMGTILRLADWFGVEDVVCSPDCASAWQPKVVQASMGALARVRVHRLDLVEWMDALPQGMPVMGTFLDGDNINSVQLPSSGVLVMGNEGNGISSAVAERVTHRLLIPNFPAGRCCVESLNVATATAIILSRLRITQ